MSDEHVNPSRATGPVAPLSHPQHRLLLAEHLLPGCCDGLVGHAYRVDGAARPDLMVRAIQTAARRHPALRTMLQWQERGAVGQVIGPAESPWPVPELILGDAGHPSTDREVASRICADWWDRPFDLFAGRSFRFRLISRGEGRHLLCLSFHHLFADGWSARVLVRSVSAVYAALVAGTDVECPRDPAPGPSDHALWEARFLGQWAREDVPYWQEQLGRPAQAPGPPSDVMSEGERREHTIALPAARTHGFMSLSRRGRLAVALQSAARSLADPNGPSLVRLATIASGRWEPRFRDSVGCFVNPVVVPVPWARIVSSDDAWRATLAAVEHCLRHSRTPLDVVLRHAWGAGRVESPAPVTVSLNDWSAIAPVAGPVDVRALVLSAPRTSTGLMVDITVEAGGTVLVRTRWREGALSCDAAQELALQCAEGVAAAR